MKFFISPSFLLLILSAVSAVHAQQKPQMLRIDSLSVSPIAPYNQGGSIQAVSIPTVDFPDGAKILTWWPDTNYDYNMPNMLSPEPTRPHVQILNGEVKEYKPKNK